MKITPAILTALRSAIEVAGGAGEFSRKSGVDPANISRYLSGRVHSINDDNWLKLARFLLPGDPEAPALPRRADIIVNTAALRECIKDAMLERNLPDGAALNRFIGYDSPETLERLLAGKLDWFPEVLSFTLTSLGIRYEDAPLAPGERSLLVPPDMFQEGGRLVRPIPVVDWANAAGHLGILGGDGATMRHWDPQETETVLSPVGGRQDTLAFRVTGISMEPSLCDGDVILVEPATSPEEVPENKIVVAKFSDTYTPGGCVVCKRLHHREDGTLLLTSDNPSGEIFSCRPADLVWLGRVIRRICEL